DSIFDAKRTQRGWKSSYLHGDPDVGYIDGLTVDEGYSSTTQKYISSSPSLHAALLLTEALRARGVTVSGGARAGRSPSTPVEVARVTSPPLSEIVAYVDRWSVNYGAEILLKDLGASFGG